MAETPIHCPICGRHSTITIPLIADASYFGWHCPQCDADHEVRMEFWPADERQFPTPRSTTNAQ